MSKVSKIISAGIILILTILLVLSIYPFNIITSLDKIVILNDNKVVSPGELLRYQFTYEKKFNIPGRLEKRITIKNGEYTLCYKSFMGNLPTGKHTITASVLLPNTDFIIGDSELILDVEYYLFRGLRVLHDSIESEPFEIRRHK